MYKYFVSFKYANGQEAGYGNVVLESNSKISDFDNINNMQNWINDAQKWIENNANFKKVIILNFIFIN